MLLLYVSPVQTSPTCISRTRTLPLSRFLVSRFLPLAISCDVSSPLPISTSISYICLSTTTAVSLLPYFLLLLSCVPRRAVSARPQFLAVLQPPVLRRGLEVRGDHGRGRLLRDRGAETGERGHTRTNMHTFHLSYWSVAPFKSTQSQTEV